LISIRLSFIIGLIFVLVEHVPMFNPCQIRGLIFGIEIGN
jgi:hypothetical protein